MTSPAASPRPALTLFGVTSSTSTPETSAASLYLTRASLLIGPRRRPSATGSVLPAGAAAATAAVLVAAAGSCGHSCTVTETSAPARRARR